MAWLPLLRYMLPRALVAAERRERRVHPGGAPVARMYPDRIPQAVRDDLGHQAECDVYEALRDGLADDWSVFGWASWVLKRRHDGALNGEADFVLAHAEHGVFVLEVKGGLLAVDGVTGRWSSQSMDGTVHALKTSPVRQAERNRHAIEHKLREIPGWPGTGVTFGHAVAFPDCALPDGAVGADSPRDILLPYGDLGRMRERMEAIAAFWRRPDGRVALGEHGVRLVTGVFANSFQLRMPLGRAIAEDARRSIELTETQFSVLDGLSRNRRVVVTGGAGTGKTLLALEKAKRLARDHGFRTLLTCFNLPLAEYLRQSAGGIERLTVLNFHELCAERARRLGHDLPDPGRSGLPNAFFRETLPSLLVDALGQDADRFEAIVVDEGQDFSDTDRAALELALEDRADSVLYVFQDETQAIYREGVPWPERGMVPFQLTENRRNTRAIHGVLERLARGTRTLALGPAGRAPRFVPAEGPRAAARELRRVLHHLIHDESVAPGAIAVLVSSRRALPELVEDGRIGSFEVTTGHHDGSGRVLVESVTRFKGLERDVVVLVRMDPVDYVEFQPMLYVGASRARSQLVVIGDEPLLARFREAGDGGTA